MEEKSFNKLNRNHHQEISELWDKCFGDIPIVNQRLIKALGTIFSKKAYSHHKKNPITVATLQGVEIDLFKGDKYFDKNSEQQENAQNLIHKIVNKFKNGNNQASSYLKDFLKDKKLTIGISKDISDDAGFVGYNPLTKEIYLDFCAGVFYWHKEHPQLFNEDSLAKTVGHELGHAIKSVNQGLKTHPNSVGYTTNSWEEESFCDAIGTALCIGAGYCLEPTIEKYKQFEEKDLVNHREEDPHPPLVQRRKLIELILKAYGYENIKKEVTPFSLAISDVDWSVKKDVSGKEKVKQIKDVESL